MCCKAIELETGSRYLGVEILKDGRIDVEIANKIKKTNKIYCALNRPITGNTEIDKNIIFSIQFYCKTNP